MSNPYNYPFIQKDNTMYLSTISTPSSTQQSKTSPVKPPTTEKVLSNKEISQGPHLKFSFLKTPLHPTSNYPHTLNLFLIAVSTSKRHRTLYLSMILKEPDLSAQISELEESLILFVLSTYYLQLQKWCSIMVVNLSETLFSAKTSMAKKANLGSTVQSQL